MEKNKIQPFKTRLVVQSTAKFLAERFGGKWRYEHPTTWMCSDGIRSVSRVSMSFGVGDTGPFEPSKLCMYFTDGRTPKWVE